jgi:hypothetical protein
LTTRTVARTKIVLKGTSRDNYDYSLGFLVHLGSLSLIDYHSKLVNIYIIGYSNLICFYDPYTFSSFRAYACQRQESLVKGSFP